MNVIKVCFSQIKWKQNEFKTETFQVKMTVLNTQ